MIINNARGSHSSPGVYTKEVDIQYSVKSLGITSLGVAGETVKGPAFEPIKIEKWSDFVDYFGSTSAEKFKSTGVLKYELPYIAKEYLKESKQLHVCRVLGLSGYYAGPAYFIGANTGGNTYPVVVLRQKAEYSEPIGSTCSGSGDVINFKNISVSVSKYDPVVYIGDCNGEVHVDTASTETGIDYTIVTTSNQGKFNINVTAGTGSAMTTTTYPVSLNPEDKDYIYNVFGTTPFSNDTPLFVEAVYDYALMQMAVEADGDSSKTVTIVTGACPTSTAFTDYQETFRCACTPWFVSQIEARKKGENKVESNAKRLFRLYTISDGNVSNTEVKVSIEKIKPEDGSFDLVVRAMKDSDGYPVVLEKFIGCTLTPGDKNYLPLRVGSYDGTYELKSKYIAVEMSENETLGSVPCGFEGYPLHDSNKAKSGWKMLEIGYNTEFDYNVKAKRQYFGFSDLTGIDYDVLSYKGNPNSLVLSNGFHLDSYVNLSEDASGVTGMVNVDGEFKKFTGVSGKSEKSAKIPSINGDMSDTLYEDIATRKFTVCFYGGFDGWDIYRRERTIGDEYKVTKYKGYAFNEGQKSTGNNNYAFVRSDYDLNLLGLPGNAIPSDYYAFLAAYRKFSNPEDVDINVFATPGIDWYNNELLVEDALDVIEDTEDGRGGDALYVVSCPNDEVASDAIYHLEGTSIDSSYATTYWPWIKYFDKDENVYVNMPVTKDVVRNLAFIDNTSYPWFAPAGVNRGDVNCVRASVKTRLADEDALYDARINPVKTFAADGVKIWGNKTMYSVDSPLNRVNVRRLMLRIKKLISNVGKQLIFDQYDTSLKNQFLGLVTPILSNVKANGGIYDYRIDVDDSVEARDAHTLPCTIHVKPTPSLEYIDLTFTIYPESVDFRD